MRSIYIIAVFTAITFLSSGCMKILMKTYGIHGIRSESVTDIKKYCSKINIDSGNILFYKDSLTFMNVLTGKDTVYNVFWVGIPDLLVFNNKGELVKHKSDGTCNAPGFDYTQKVCEKINSNEKKNTNYKLPDFLKFFKDEFGRPIQIKAEDYDAVICITFAKYMGKLNKDHVKVWEDNLKKQNCKIKILKICGDPQDDMHLEFDTEYKVDNTKLNKNTL